MTTAQDYSINDPIQALAAHEIHVYQAFLPDILNELTRFNAYLSQTEIDQAQRFKTPSLSQYFVLRRGLLRWLLAKLLDEHPDSLRFHTNAQGKPSLSDYPELHFNLSHSGDYVLLAVSHDSPLGVDIEQIKPHIVTQDLAQFILAADEWNAYIGLNEGEKVAAFYNVWAQKEAFIKAIGLGLSFPLKDVSVAISANGQQGLHALSHPDYSLTDWQVLPLLCPNDYSCALVTRHNESTPRICQLQLTL